VFSERRHAEMMQQSRRLSDCFTDEKRATLKARLPRSWRESSLDRS